MKKKGIIITGISILLVIILIISLCCFSMGAVSRKSDKVNFVINSGSSTRSVINDLSDANIIRSKFAALIYTKLNKNIMISYGTFELDRNMNLKEIFEYISTPTNAVQDTISVTFVEGKRITNYVKLISENFGYEEKEIYAVLKDKEYLNELIKKYECLDESILNDKLYYALEGYLFPATYEFYKDASIKDIIEKMLNQTERIIKKHSELIKKSDKSIHEILSIASIVENESGKVLEFTDKKTNKTIKTKNAVSQVIYTRLDKRMALGMDVTTYYGVQKELTESLTKVDLNDKNAYNTRLAGFIGLPVGPISNPGEAAILAALQPSDTDYVYFYAEVSTGKVYFTSSYKEFLTFKELYS